MNAAKRGVLRYHSRQGQECVALPRNPDVLARYDVARGKTFLRGEFLLAPELDGVVSHFGPPRPLLSKDACGDKS
jgi:hypothetical protein